MARVEGDGFVVVPHRPGPLVALDPGSGRDRDELDELIDDLFPDLDERPGWFDSALATTGVSLLCWVRFGDGPAILAAAGIVALGLASILPLRTAWRWIQRRSRRRGVTAKLAAGVALDASSRSVGALAEAYRTLYVTTTHADAALLDQAHAAAHAALLEVATLLDGRTPSSVRELDYVDQRSLAVAALVDSLRAIPADPAAPGAPTGTLDAAPTFDPDVLVAAREELDRLAPITSVSRIEQVTAEARERRGR